MRVFVCEYVTGGGMRGEALPASLVREGAMMRDALIRDLSELPGVSVVSTHDGRLATPACDSREISGTPDAWTVWAELAATSDVAWAIVPETGGALSCLTRLMRASGARVVGPDDETIQIASSKRLTAERLVARGVPAAQVWRPGEVPPGARGPFVIKPDDGAGCDDTRLIETPPGARDLPDGHVVQAFAAGEPASLTVLRSGGVTRLLAANRQHVAIENGVFRFSGLTVGAIDDRTGELQRLAEAVAGALPGLSGLFGIDLVLGPSGPVVIEINPRLTTAYAVLRDAIGCNPAALVEPFAGQPRAASTARRPVEVAV